MLFVEEAMWPLCLEGNHTPYPPCVCAISRDGNQKLNEGIPSDGHRQPCIAVIWIFYRFGRPILFDSYFPYVLWATKFRNRRDTLSLFSYGVDRSLSPPVMHIVQELTVTNTDNPGIRNVLVSNCTLCTLPPDCRAFLKCQVRSIVTWQRMPQKWSVRLVLTFHHFSVAGSCLQPRAERWVLHRRLCNDATHAGARVHLGDDAHENQGGQVPCLVSNVTAISTPIFLGICAKIINSNAQKNFSLSEWNY